MLEVSYILAFFGAVFLLAAAAAWLRIARSPSETEDAAARAGIDSRRVKSAAIATAIAFAFSGVAAILGMVGWLLR
jgi:hypothetical protein